MNSGSSKLADLISKAAFRGLAASATLLIVVFTVVAGLSAARERKGVCDRVQTIWSSNDEKIVPLLILGETEGAQFKLRDMAEKDKWSYISVELQQGDKTRRFAEFGASSSSAYLCRSEFLYAGAMRGTYQFQYPASFLLPLIASLAFAIVAVLSSLGFVVFLQRKVIQQDVLIPIDDIRRGMSRVAEGKAPEFQTGGRCDEFNELQATVQESFRRHLELHHQLEQKRLAQELANVASQVAHDIRSPLAALEVVSGDVAQLPEDKRIMIRSAVSRIRDIANSLMDKNRGTDAGVRGGTERTAAEETVSPQLLSSLIEAIVSEKRLQFRSHSRVEIEAWLDAQSYGIFAEVQPVEFKRLLSNLINNAVESFADGPGSVRVDLSAREGRAIVSVKDDGKGIPKEILGKLGRRGETYGKADGTGLGLYHAKTCAEAWGGRLLIASEVGKGATITVDLPQAPTPDWFVSALTLAAGRPVVILDDDASVHQIWQGRLDALRAREHGIDIVHTSTPAEIRNWVKAAGERAREALFLMDYELLGHRETGLTLAEEFGIGEQAVLVTSRYEEAGVLESCRKLKTRMIPKGLAGLVPIRVGDPAQTPAPARERWDAILIDDDPLARMTWKMAAARADRKFRSFATAAEFFDQASGVALETPIYIDAELGGGVDGAAESLRIRDLGFQAVYLATGHEKARFAGRTHLRAIVGKEPPWDADAAAAPHPSSPEEA